MHLGLVKGANTKFPFMVQIPSHTIGSIIHQIIGISNSIWESIEKYIFQSRAYSIILFTSVEKALNVRLFYCFSSYVSESNWKYAL